MKLGVLLEDYLVTPQRAVDFFVELTPPLCEA
jgi:hypothetical protein